jgi:hypothetical protein
MTTPVSVFHETCLDSVDRMTLVGLSDAWETLKDERLECVQLRLPTPGLLRTFIHKNRHKSYNAVRTSWGRSKVSKELSMRFQYINTRMWTYSMVIFNSSAHIQRLASTFLGDSALSQVPSLVQSRP